MSSRQPIPADVRALAVARLRAAADTLESSGDLGGGWYATYFDCDPVLGEGFGATLPDVERAIEEIRDDGEWPELGDMAAHEVGIIIPILRATQVDQRPDPSGEFDYLCDYVMRPVVEGEGDER